MTIEAIYIVRVGLLVCVCVPYNLHYHKEMFKF